MSYEKAWIQTKFYLLSPTLVKRILPKMTTTTCEELVRYIRLIKILKLKVWASLRGGFLAWLLFEGGPQACIGEKFAISFSLQQ